ncbi:magnesium chelatase subunit H [Aquariibacter lacus]|nr:magnesium chelatase subunit H [Piscinibacter lacus]
MTPKRTTAAEAHAPGAAGTGMRVVLVTMDAHLVSSAARAMATLERQLPGLVFEVHLACAWAEDAEALARCRAAIAGADLLICAMLFMEDHYLPVLDALQARRPDCDAVVALLSAAPVMKLTRMGRFSMDGSSGGPMALLRKLRGKPAEGKPAGGGGAQQMAMLRRLPKILRFIPGTAQDLRAWMLAMQYWLAGSQENLGALVHFLVDRYAEGPRKGLRGRGSVPDPVAYPEVGVYHPRLQAGPAAQGLSEDAGKLPALPGATGTVGLLLMRSYLLAGNRAHYDGVIAALEARGLRVIPVFASGLDARPAVERYFLDGERSRVDAVVSLTGFSLVGGPAYNDSRSAEALLARLDVPYLAAMPVEFQSLTQWQDSSRGLLPVESTIMVALPELDGATGAMVFGGRAGPTAPAAGTAPATPAVQDGRAAGHDMAVHPERAAMLADRVARLVALRRSPRAERRIAIVLFNFPPNGGAAGSAAHLGVFESLHHVLGRMAAEGYRVDVPESVDALREALLQGNASRHGTEANVHARIPTADHIRCEPHLAEIEATWGPAPGRQLSDGASLLVLGRSFGEVFVGLQPPFGIEGDPMRLLFEGGHAPTHAFSAFYRWIREDFGAHAVLHFGTHGALEFMPGKQAGLSAACWPDRLIRDLPSFYLYAANNPSEGMLAKRRAAATLISHITPPLTQAGLYRGLVDLRDSLDRWRRLPPETEAAEAGDLAQLIQAQAAELDLAPLEPAWPLPEAPAAIETLRLALAELEATLIPQGLHVLGRPPSAHARLDLLHALAEAGPAPHPGREALAELVAGHRPAEVLARHPLTAAGRDDAAASEALARLEGLARTDAMLCADHETDGLLHALDAGYLRPAPGGDLLRTPEVLPTGRNLHGFDPFRLPSAWAVRDGARQAERLLARHQADGHPLPETVALVLWGTDNLKHEGTPIAQALALLGARPRFDSYGRLAGAELMPLASLGRPRIDVVITLSGIFRDLLPLQIKLLAEAAFLAASADEPESQNFIRKHALAWQRGHGGDLETASLRVFGNAEGAYGANVNHLVDSSRWEAEDELAETYCRRKGHAYGLNGRPMRQPELMAEVLAGVQLAYQSLDSVELGVTTVDTYFDTLGGLSRAVQRAKGAAGLPAEVAPVYIGDSTRGEERGTVRTLSEQVALETRTRMLNPKWAEAMLAHGHEGVRQIEAHVTNTFAWSATTGQVQPWVYQQLAQTFMLDPAMRERLAQLNPAASVKVANRLLEAQRRQYWQPNAAVLDAMQRAGEELEDRLEGVLVRAAA